MVVADEQSYEEVISKLRAYTSKVFESCNDMYCAGRDCVDNTEGDPAAVRSNDNLGQALNQINEAVQTIDTIIAALQEELDRIREAAAKSGE